MKFLLETALSVSGIIIFFAIAFFVPSFFWIGLVFLLVLGTVAFILGYFRREKNPEQTLEEVVETLEEDKKEEK